MNLLKTLEGQTSSNSNLNFVTSLLTSQLTVNISILLGTCSVIGNIQHGLCYDSKVLQLSVFPFLMCILCTMLRNEIINVSVCINAVSEVLCRWDLCCNRQLLLLSPTLAWHSPNCLTVKCTFLTCHGATLFNYTFFVCLLFSISPCFHLFPVALCNKHWWSGVVVSALASINEVNQRRAQLVLRRVTVSGFNSRCPTFFQYVTNQPPNPNSIFHPPWVGKWVPASAGKAKAGMVHSVSGWTRGVQVKLWDPLRTRSIPERLRGVFTTRRYTNTRSPYLTLPLCEVCYIGLYRVLIMMSCQPIVSWSLRVFHRRRRHHCHHHHHQCFHRWLTRFVVRVLHVCTV